ncbi:swarming motility protein ybiA [Dunaliella salina]|uniref:Swarming motility protein ybiA n=1 Tax=Dunaliella salina TaxID=3046 RepID=A0ABQ7FYF5_DUNSA|nr:swarming motility protein ybiA [Dunaliella salina]|eukprot:KAF5827401.1 swarming motility protein ybiA [Dunaliella salina]
MPSQQRLLQTAQRYDVNVFSGLKQLSNFHKSPFFDKKTRKTFPTVEHKFQAYKYENRKNFNDILKTFLEKEDPLDAKRLGRKGKLPDEYNEWVGGKRIRVMRDALREKFSQNPILKETLLRTGNVVLIESVPRGDKFWGVKGNVGANVLGQLLMELREDAKKHV